MTEKLDGWTSLEEKRPDEEYIEVIFHIPVPVYDGGDGHYYARISDNQAIAIEEFTHWRPWQKDSEIAQIS